jgi:predicted nucleic acid-binding Zn ribbon protein
VSVQSTRTLVPQLLRDLKLDADVTGWGAVEAWPKIVGERVARRTRAVRFQEGTLRVEVQGSAWAYELGFLKRPLLRELQKQVGPQVRQLQFVIVAGGTQR